MRWGHGDVTMFATGTTAQVALSAGRKLDATVVHCPVMKPFDRRWVSGMESDVVLTVEDHSIIGGLGSAVAEVLAESGWSGKFKRIGYPDVFPSGYGTQDEMRARYGISVDNIVKTVQELRGTTR
jgi:transketolase